VRDTARAYRAWALRAPNSYRLIFETTSGSAVLDPERILPASPRSMNIFLAALAEQQPDHHATIPRGLRTQLEQWGTRSLSDVSLTVLCLALTFWTRLHGFISLELGAHLSSTGVDPELLFDVKIRQLTSSMRADG
jgi:hypothetical protein